MCGFCNDKTRDLKIKLNLTYFLAGTVLVRFHSLRVWSSDTVTRQGSTGWNANARTPSKWLRNVYFGFHVFLKVDSLLDDSWGSNRTAWLRSSGILSEQICLLVFSHRSQSPPRRSWRWGRRGHPNPGRFPKHRPTRLIGRASPFQWKMEEALLQRETF